MKKYLIYFLSLMLIIAFGFGTGIILAKASSQYAGKIKSFLSSAGWPVSRGLAETEVSDFDNVLQDSTAADVPKNDTATKSMPNLYARIEEAAKKAAEKIKQDKTKETFSFAVLGDTQAFEAAPPSGNLQKAVESINKQKVDMAFTVGDLVADCQEKNACEKSYANWKNIMAPILARTYAVVGNHDRTNKSIADKIWQQEFANLPANGPRNFSKQVYSFDFKNSHFVVLDTEKPEGQVDVTQRAWLENDLKLHRKANTFIFYHEPAFSTREKRSDGRCLEEDSEQRDALWEIISKYNVKAVFNGHEHFFSRMQRDGTYQFIVGNTDAPSVDTPKPSLSEYFYQGNSYAIVAVDGQKMNIKLYSVDGNLINSFDFT